MVKKLQRLVSGILNITTTHMQLYRPLFCAVKRRDVRTASVVKFSKHFNQLRL